MTTSERPIGYDDAVEGNRLVAFLYTLLRDHLPASEVEALVCDLERSRTRIQFSNDFLAAYALELCARLNGVPADEALFRAQEAVPRSRKSGAA